MIENLADLLRVPLTPSQLSICVELLQRGISHRSLVNAIASYSQKVYFLKFTVLCAVTDEWC